MVNGIFPGEIKASTTVAGCIDIFEKPLHGRSMLKGRLCSNLDNAAADQIPRTRE